MSQFLKVGSQFFSGVKHAICRLPIYDLGNGPNPGGRQAGSKTGWRGCFHHEPITSLAQRLAQVGPEKNTWTHCGASRESYCSTWPSQQAQRRALAPDQQGGPRLGDAAFPTIHYRPWQGYWRSSAPTHSRASLASAKGLLPPRGQARQPAVTHRLSTACMEMKRAGTLKVSKKTSAARSRFFRGFKGASVRSTGCWGKMPRQQSGEDRFPALVSTAWLAGEPTRTLSASL